ncbi:hypothetical protein WME97_06595 [Sorangium sp. So ce367]|uniref:hypothetical protein n=1 Tax=Sorangium sp. So ce367 TaxID=3133305 RepID=UPI003F6116F6
MVCPASSETVSSDVASSSGASSLQVSFSPEEIHVQPLVLTLDDRFRMAVGIHEENQLLLDIYAGGPR